MDLESRKQVAIKACAEIGKILLDSFGQDIKIESKGDRDLVTDIDKKAELTIIELIKRNFPEDGIISEESPDLSAQSGFTQTLRAGPTLACKGRVGTGLRWIIDPIDGTHNFIHNIAIFGTSVALECKGEIVLGLINMPVTNELYIAQKGEGAYCNGKRIAVSKRNLKESTLVYDSSLRLHKRPMLRSLGELVDKVFNVRMFGSTVRSLSYLACGQVDIEIEFNDKVWDFAAGLLLVEEAGGKCTDFQGRPWDAGTKRYVASNGIVHQELVKIMNAS